MPMWKRPASVLCGCLAALPLIGCAGDVATPSQATAVTPAAIAEPAPNYVPAPRVYAVGPAVPAAVLVLWPGDDTLPRDPALWTAQGFDVVMPQPADIYRLVADQQAALAQLVALGRRAGKCADLGRRSRPGHRRRSGRAAARARRGIGRRDDLRRFGCGQLQREFLLFRPRNRRAAQSRGQTVRGLRHRHARDYRAATVGASGAPEPG